MDLTRSEFLVRPAACATLLMGEVLALDEERCLIRTDSGELWAERAASCLLLPAHGDKVLVSACLPDQIFLLAVLVRESGNRQTILGPGVTLEVRHEGDLKLSARSGLHLESGEFTLAAKKASIFLAQVSTFTQDFFASFTNARWVGALAEATIDRVSQCFGSSHRRVRSLDQVLAGSCELVAEQVMNVQGQQVLISAEKLARVDADQVHIG